MREIPGKEIAGKIISQLKSRPVPKKILAAVLVGDDPGSISFLKQKQKTAKELGVDFRLYKFGAELKNDDLRKEMGKLAKLSRVGGIIVQLPLPAHINRRYVLNAIPIEKDVDVLSEKAQRAFAESKNPVLPPSVGVVNEILTIYDLQLTTSRVAVVGLGFLVGKPISEWLKDKTKELYLLDIGSDFSILKNADLVITGVGKPGLIKPEMLKENAGVIDFGYGVETKDQEQETSNSKKIHGDFDTAHYNITTLKHLSFYTPTPGGTGPILVAKLMENFYKLAV